VDYVWKKYIEKMDIHISASLQRQCDIFDAIPRNPSIDRLTMVSYAVDNFNHTNPLPEHCCKPTYLTRFRAYDAETERMYSTFTSYIEYDTGDPRAECSGGDDSVDEKMPTFP
jgi:hypothetical protein